MGTGMSAPTTLSEALADGWGDDDWEFEDVVEGDAHGDAGDPRTGVGWSPYETGVALKCAEPCVEEVASEVRERYRAVGA
jgi:hypothetical protein